MNHRQPRETQPMPSGSGEMLLVPLVLVTVFLLWGALAPFETLGWWAGWFGDKIYNDNIPSDGVVRSVPPNPQAYVLFLSGIGRVSGHTFSFREQEFLRQLAIALPNAAVIDDIFPYSVNNLALTGQPVFAGLWRWALRAQTPWASAGRLFDQRPQLVSGGHRLGSALCPALQSSRGRGISGYTAALSL